MQTVRLHIHLRWWFRFYLHGLVTVAYLSGKAPDPDMVKRVVERAVVVKAEVVRFALAA